MSAEKIPEGTWARKINLMDQRDLAKALKGEDAIVVAVDVMRG